MVLMVREDLISDKYANDGLAARPLSDSQVLLKHELINDHRIRYKKVERCLLCDNSDFTLIARKDRYGQKLETVVCDICGLIFSLNQMEEESAEVFYSEYYRGIYGGTNGSQVANMDTLYKSSQKNRSVKFVKRNSVIVEIGTGGGWNLIPYKGYRHFGYDYNKAYLDYGKNKYGLNLFLGGIDQARASGIKGDYLLLRHVLEHTNDPVKFLSTIKTIAAEGSIVNISVPCANYLIVSGDDLLSELQNAHNFLFDEVTLELLAIRSGYHIKILLGGNLVLKYERNCEKQLEYKRILDRIRAKPRGHRVVRYLKFCEMLLPVKKKWTPQSVHAKLFYSYYSLKPVEVLKKFLMFGKILSP